ncbi:hypothetical protein HO173_010985 [Letharia columbiana]|uniref:Nuclear fusion protein KAR5 n=1 Tax=Letharia columbiana TaxID=112416 RepID=A0A8H6FLS9_9LECA|nr:uncharacterized protein HO173_010985 [Letharia columbiana]KAF6230869.1 hypothetical protein HO173_010985 [Letharia columbiana]
MASTLKCNCCLAIVVVLLLLLPRSKAFGFSKSRTRVDSASKERRPFAPDQDLTALIRHEPVDQTGIYTHALQLLSSMQSSPSCNRLAASTLLDSCHTIDDWNRNAEDSLEDIRSVYAAQLAMCEIVSAGSAVPQACRSLDVSRGTNVQQTSGFKSIRSDQLGLCLQALESKPQWWTSYSNSKQNAMVMCQAARVDIEKDELIKLHKSAVEINADANAALLRTAKEVNDGLNQLQSNFALAKQMFQDQLMHDIEVSSTKTESFFEKLVKGMDTAVQSTLSKMASTVRAMDLNAASLSENVHKANVDSANLEKNIGRVFQQVVTGSAELAATQTEQWDLSRVLAVELQSSLQKLKEGEIGLLLDALVSMQGQLQTSNELVTFMYLRQNELYERVQDLDHSFTGLESKAETLHAAQTRQAEMQAHLHNQTRIEMLASQSLIVNVTSSARGLHEAVDDAAAKIAKMAWFGALPGELFRLGWLVLAVAVLHWYSPNHAKFVATVIGFMILVHASGILSDLKSIPSDLTFIHHASGYKVRLWLLIRLAATLGVIAIIAAIIYQHTNVFRALRSSIVRNKPSDLAFIGLEVSERQHRQWSI